MLLGPIFAAEMMTAARRGRHYQIRVAYAVGLLLLLWVNYQIVFPFSRLPLPQQLSAFAGTFFRSFAFVQILAVIVLVPSMLAGAIAQERERRTIDYLLTTRLTHSDIVLAKVGGRLMQVGVLLLAGFGILSVARVLGGIENAALLSAFVSTAAIALACAGVAIAISTWSRRARDAVRTTFSVLFLSAIVLPGFATMVAFSPAVRATMWHEPLRYVRLLSPWTMLSSIADSFSTSGRDLYLTWALYATIGVGGIVFSIVTLRRAYGSDHGEARSRRKAERRKLATRRRALGDRPMLWKDTAVDRWNKLVWTLVGLFFALMLGGMYYLRVEHAIYISDLQRMVITFSTALLSVGLLAVASRAEALVVTERDRDCWTTLLASAMDEKEIVWGKVWGALHSVRHLVGVVVSCWLAAAAFMPAALLGMCAQLITFLPLAIFAAGLGLLCAVASKPRATASVKAGNVLVIVNLVAVLLGSDMPILGGDSIRSLVWALVAPYHLFWSGSLGWLFDSNSFRNFQYSSQAAWAVAIYVLGMLLYAGGGIVLIKSCVRSFDQYTERTGPWGQVGAGMASQGVGTFQAPARATSGRGEEEPVEPRPDQALPNE